MEYEGLSPRVRGNPDDQHDRHWTRVYLGNQLFGLILGIAVYPRVYGETLLPRKVYPRVYGETVGPQRQESRPRSIPACTGKP